jgi:FG-GAP repeat
VPSDFPSSFGYALTLDGRSPIVGAWGDSQIAPFAGSAYVFRPLEQGDAAPRPPCILQSLDRQPDSPQVHRRPGFSKGPF